MGDADRFCASPSTGSPARGRHQPLPRARPSRPEPPAAPEAGPPRRPGRLSSLARRPAPGPADQRLDGGGGAAAARLRENWRRPRRVASHRSPGSPATSGIDDSALRHPDFPRKRRRSASAEPIEESAFDFQRGLRARGAILASRQSGTGQGERRGAAGAPGPCRRRERGGGGGLPAPVPPP